jgi:tetratricopeptide (TPR) repeat protein
LPQAEALLAKSISLLRKQLSHTPDDAELTRALAIALNNRSFVQQAVDWSAARKSSEEAVTLLTRLCDAAETNAGNLISLRSDLALCLNNLGAIFGHQRRPDEAAAAYRRAIEVQEQLVRQAPAVVELRSDLAVTWNNLGQSLSAVGDSEAAAAYETARRRLAELVADVPSDLRYRSSLAGVLNNQALGLEQTGQLAAALKHYRQAIELQREALEKAPQQAQFRDLLSKHYTNYCRALRAAGSAELAAEAALQRRELWPNDATALVEIALELGRAADLLSPGEQREGIIDAAAETLRQAAAVGFVLPGSLAELPDFAPLECSDELAARVAQEGS